MPSIPHKLVVVTKISEQTIQLHRIAGEKGGIDGMYDILLLKMWGKIKCPKERKKIQTSSSLVV